MKPMGDSIKPLLMIVQVDLTDKIFDLNPHRYSSQILHPCLDKNTIFANMNAYLVHHFSA